MGIYAALIRSAVGRSDEVIRLMRNLVFQAVSGEVEVVGAYTLTGSFDAILLFKSETDESTRRFVSNIERAVGAKVLLHEAHPVTP
jgi:hypothetical protein